MLKILLKKQFAEFLASLSRNRRTGKQRTGGGLILYAILLIVIGLSLAVSFTMMYMLFAKPLFDTGFGHVYFAFTGLITAMIWLIGGMVVTYGVIY